MSINRGRFRIKRQLLDLPFSDSGQEKNSTVVDVDENIYNTVEIGNQLWMAENLKVTHYRDGAAIPKVTDSSRWGNLFAGAYCDYKNNAEHSVAYGRLYNGYALMDPRRLAPKNWHVATEQDWENLESYLGMPDEILDIYGSRGMDEGGKLKESGTNHWCMPNTAASDVYGFGALPAGFRLGYGLFESKGVIAAFWSSIAHDDKIVRYRFLYYSSSEISRCCSSEKRLGLSVRCVKD